MKLHLAGLPGLVWQRRASAVLGVIIVLMLWAGVFIIYRGDVEQDYRDVEQRNQNYALLFEENVLRSIGEIDKALLYIRRSVEAAKDTTDYQTIVSSTDVLSEIIVQVAVIDANGISRGTNALPAPKQLINISDREHFKVHVNSTQDNLFISKPVIGRASGKWSVQFTRRFSNKDGSFAGVVVASMDPAHFTSLYDKIDLGTTTAVAMIGDDGIVRSSGGGIVARLSLGQDLTGTDLFNRIQSKATAIFHDTESPWLNFVASARKVRNYPLWVVVSASDSDIYRSSWDSLKQNVLIAAFMTVLTLIALEQILRAEARAVQKSRHLQLTLKHISQGIMLVTKERHVPIINQRCADLLQLPKEMIEEPPNLDDLAPYETRNGHVPLWSEADLMPSGSAASRKPRKPSITDFRRPDGTFIEVRKTQLPDGGFVQTFTDITTRREAEANIAKLASEDPLTRLYNRRVFRARLQELSKRSGNGRFAILFMDMDRFKVVNDTLGHHVGDILLTEVAARLQAIADATELLFRLGGDEFALLMSTADSHEAIERRAQQVIAALTQPFRLGQHVISTSVSIGIAVGPGDGKTEDDLLMAADLALYAVKSTVRGAYRFYEKTMTDEVSRRREIEIDLRDALDHDGLELYYQPIFNLRHNTIAGFEALSRWPHPTKGMISPARFIPIAEDCGLIVQLGNWALMQACRTAAQ